MAIKPLSGALPVKNYVSFGYKKNRNIPSFGNEQNHTATSRSRFAARYIIPFIFLIPCSSGSMANTQYEKPPKEEILPQQQNKDVLMYKSTKVFENQSISYYGYSNDDNPNTMEKLKFIYQKKSNNEICHLRGVIVAICPTEISGRYMIAYKQADDSGKLGKGLSVALVPKQLIGSVINILNAKKNTAVLFPTPKDLAKVLGENAVTKVSDIAGAATCCERTLASN